MKRIFAVSFFILFLGACATPDTAFTTGSSEEIQAEREKQYTLTLQERYKEMRRLASVSHPILIKNAEICGDKVSDIYGFGVWNKPSLQKEYREIAENLYGLDDFVNVYITTPGSPAERAGINSGDKILSVNGKEIAPGKSAIKNFWTVLDKQEGEETTFTVSRNGQIRDYTVSPVTACDYPVYVGWNMGIVNAFADGKNIIVSQGMMRFAKADSELALVVSHELGHNVMSHINKKRVNAIGAGIVGLVIDAAIGGNGSITRGMMDMGAGAHSVAFEQEADYVGIYAMARAGYSTGNAAQFWRRMAAENDAKTINTGGTHPTSPERFIAIQKAHEEVSKKRASGAPLVPNLKEDGDSGLKTDDSAPYQALN